MSRKFWGTRECQLKVKGHAGGQWGQVHLPAPNVKGSRVMKQRRLVHMATVQFFPSLRSGECYGSEHYEFIADRCTGFTWCRCRFRSEWWEGYTGSNTTDRTLFMALDSFGHTLVLAWVKGKRHKPNMSTYIILIAALGCHGHAVDGVGAP